MSWPAGRPSVSASYFALKKWIDIGRRVALWIFRVARIMISGPL